MKYDDCPCGYPTVETKIKNQTEIAELYSLNEYQKSFHSCVTFKVELIDTFNIKVNYFIPSDVALIMDFDLNSFNEEFDKAMLGQFSNYITVHLIVMKIVMETFNSHLIGICLNKDVETQMMKQIKKQKEFV